MSKPALIYPKGDADDYRAMPPQRRREFIALILANIASPLLVENFRAGLAGTPPQYDLTPISDLLEALDGLNEGKKSSLLAPAANKSGGQPKGEIEERVQGRIAGVVDFLENKSIKKLMKKQAMEIVARQLKNMGVRGFESVDAGVVTITGWTRNNRLKGKFSREEKQKVTPFDGWEDILEDSELAMRLLAPFDRIWRKFAEG
jgi:hypothetical protein